MADVIRILVVGAEIVEAAVLSAELDKMKTPYEVLRARDERELLALCGQRRCSPDAILALDSDEPFDAVAILAVAKERMPHSPLVVIAAPAGEDVAIETLKSGATDYILTGNLSRLAPALHRALREGEAQREKAESDRALREAEMRFRALFENAPVGVTIRSHGELLLANRAYLRMRGCESASELPDTLMVDMLESTSRARFERQSRHPGATTEGTLEGVAMRKDGSVFPFEMVAANVTLPDGEAHVAFFSDITERRRAEIELDSYRRDLEKMVRQRTDDLVVANQRLREETESKIRFLSSMSHELRIPLNSVIGFAGVLLQGLAGPLNDEQRVQVGMISDAGKRLMATIDDVLDMSRIDAGKTDVHWEQFDVVELLETVADGTRLRAEEGGLELLLHTPGRAAIVVSDRSIVMRVVRDVLENALKFTPHGSVQIQAIDEDDTISITVTDTGIGIDAADLEEVFDEFHQSRGVDGGRPAGAGLGLSICRKLAGLIGGTLELASTPGTGTCVTLSIPRGPVIEMGDPDGGL